MPRRYLKRFMPTQEQLRRTRGLGFIGERLFDPDIWHLSRRSVRMATMIGIFACWIPLPVQMPLACGVSILLRSNLPMAAALCWVSNPLTLPAMVYIAYKTGVMLLGSAPIDMPDEISFAVLGERLGDVGLPFLLGSVVCGAVTGLAAAMVIDLSWRYAVLRRWRQRKRAEGSDLWRQAFRARMAALQLLDVGGARGALPETLAAEAFILGEAPALDSSPPHAVPDKSRPQG